MALVLWSSNNQAIAQRRRVKFTGFPYTHSQESAEGQIDLLLAGIDLTKQTMSARMGEEGNRFCFVTFFTTADAEQAIGKLDDTRPAILSGRTLRVEFARDADYAANDDAFQSGERELEARVREHRGRFNTARGFEEEDDDVFLPGDLL